jgi:hypothetical protein
MTTFQAFSTGRGTRRRQSHVPPIPSAGFPVQASHSRLPHYPFQPLPAPNGSPPFRYDLSQLLTASDVQQISNTGSLVFHSVGDTGDFRGLQKNFVARMMTMDADALPGDQKPAFFYHLGDVVYFAGDIEKYGDNFYAVYEDYPAYIVGITGNHDCQPDDPTDGPIDPNKVPFDGWVQNFMSKNPNQLGSLKTSAQRTQMDLPNVYWTFTTPLVTIIGLASNVGETEGEFHQDQIDWFEGELSDAKSNLPLIVAVHHPAYSGDSEHSGSSEVERMLFASFSRANRYPNMVLSGHVHNYQRFTKVVHTPTGDRSIPFVVAGAGGYINVKPVHVTPQQLPMNLGNDLSLDACDTSRNFGFLRFEVSRTQIVGSYRSAQYAPGATPNPGVVDRFTIDLTANTQTP